MVQLIGMYDSPFVRRIAVSMELLGLPFEHRNWSVGRDADKIRQYSPLGRVPALVLDNGEVLIESSAILDYLDETAGAKALLPKSGAARRRGLKLMSVATGAADKAVAQVYERIWRPEEKWHQPWLDRCRVQMDAAYAELDRECAALAPEAWLLGAQMSQADITVACCFIFSTEALNIPPQQFPALSALAGRCAKLPEFQKYHAPFFVPTTRN